MRNRAIGGSDVIMDEEYLKWSILHKKKVLELTCVHHRPLGKINQWRLMTPTAHCNEKSPKYLDVIYSEIALRTAGDYSPALWSRINIRRTFCSTLWKCRIFNWVNNLITHTFSVPEQAAGITSIWQTPLNRAYRHREPSATRKYLLLGFSRAIIGFTETERQLFASTILIFFLENAGSDFVLQ